MAKGPFDDELTPEEEAVLAAEPVIPPPDDNEEAAPAAEPVAAPAPDAAPEPAAEPEDEELKAFLERNKDKSPEDLAKLAWQQQKRANKESARSRVINDQVGALATRAQAAMKAREEAAAAAPTLKQQFRERLTTDPDAATAEMFDQMVDRRVEAADAEAQQARIDQALGFADTYIPDFGKNWPHMHSLANELGYADNELDTLDDGRALVMLSLANHSARLMKAGVMDRNGNIVAAPTSALQPVDPRLAAPDPQRTLGTGGARSTKSSQSLEQQLSDMLALSPAEFDKLDPAIFESLMRQANA